MTYTDQDREFKFVAVLEEPQEALKIEGQVQTKLKAFLEERGIDLPARDLLCHLVSSLTPGEFAQLYAWAEVLFPEPTERLPAPAVQ